MRQRTKPKRRSSKSILRLPDLDHSKSSVLQSLGSTASKRTLWICHRRLHQLVLLGTSSGFRQDRCLRYRYELESRQLAPATINLRLAAVRRLAYEASDNGLLSPDLAASIRRVKGAKRLGIRLGNWLTPAQGKQLLDAPDRASGERQAKLRYVGCTSGLRSASLRTHPAERDPSSSRETNTGQSSTCSARGHVRTVPVPAWVQTGHRRLGRRVGIEAGLVFRCVSKSGHVWGDGISEKVVWWSCASTQS